MTAVNPVRAEQVRRPEWKQNWTVPHCGSVLPKCRPICLSLRPVGSIHISCLAARKQTSAAQIAKASPPYNMKYFYSFLALFFNSIFNFFLTEAAQYECSYHRTAHYATAVTKQFPGRNGFLCYVADMPVGESSSPVVDLQSAGCPTVTPRATIFT